jgi:hypothetical protein
MDDIQVNPLTIGADRERSLAVLTFLHGLIGLNGHTSSLILNKHLTFGTWHLTEEVRRGKHPQTAAEKNNEERYESARQVIQPGPKWPQSWFRK